jgi:hypothetical protein
MRLGRNAAPRSAAKAAFVMPIQGDNLLRPAGTITSCRPTETAGRSVGIGTLTLFTWFSLISHPLAQSVT